MSHVADALAALADELRPTYPAIPSCITAGDEPRGDFSLASYLGFRGGCATFTFDEGVMPLLRKTMAHELWHAAHERGAGRISPDAEGRLTGAAYILRYDDPVLVGFHAAMRYATPLTEIIDSARSWGEYISEQMAEAFGWLVVGYRAGSAGGMWARWGGDFNARRDELAAFFRSVVPAPLVTPTFPEEGDMDAATVQKMIDEALRARDLLEAQYRQRLQNELVDKAYRPIAELQQRVINAGEVLSFGHDVPGTP